MSECCVSCEKRFGDEERRIETDDGYDLCVKCHRQLEEKDVALERNMAILRVLKKSLTFMYVTEIKDELLNAMSSQQINGRLIRLRKKGLVENVFPGGPSGRGWKLTRAGWTLLDEGKEE